MCVCVCVCVCVPLCFGRVVYPLIKTSLLLQATEILPFAEGDLDRHLNPLGLFPLGSTMLAGATVCNQLSFLMPRVENRTCVRGVATL